MCRSTTCEAQFVARTECLWRSCVRRATTFSCPSMPTLSNATTFVSLQIRKVMVVRILTTVAFLYSSYCYPAHSIPNIWTVNSSTLHWLLLIPPLTHPSNSPHRKLRQIIFIFPYDLCNIQLIVCCIFLDKCDT